MSFKDYLAQDMALVHCSPDEFGERPGALYYRASVNAAPREIRGVVTRFPPLVDNGTREHRMLVEVPNDATYGITSAEIVYGAAQVKVAYQVGGTAQWYYAMRPTEPQPDQDEGALVLELR